MSRWNDLTGGNAGQRYAARFDGLASRGAGVHGEANRCAELAPPGGSILDAGCGTGRVSIELARRGFECTGVDADASMLQVARDRAPGLRWVAADLAELDLGERFDLVVAAGNVIPLIAAGTEPEVVRRLATHLGPAGALVTGFGLDPDHLPLPEAPVDLAGYDRWCSDAGLVLAERSATWEGQPYAGGGYAVSVHRLGGRR
ncbi:MAG: class I SAM-dependent methyltransferase [Nocardioidaceae bacterium]